MKKAILDGSILRVYDAVPSFSRAGSLVPLNQAVLDAYQVVFCAGLLDGIQEPAPIYAERLNRRVIQHEDELYIEKLDVEWVDKWFQVPERQYVLTSKFRNGEWVSADDSARVHGGSGLLYESTVWVVQSSSQDPTEWPILLGDMMNDEWRAAMNKLASIYEDKIKKEKEKEELKIQKALEVLHAYQR